MNDNRQVHISHNYYSPPDTSSGGEETSSGHLGFWGFVAMLFFWLPVFMILLHTGGLLLWLVITICLLGWTGRVILLAFTGIVLVCAYGTASQAQTRDTWVAFTTPTTWGGQQYATREECERDNRASGYECLPYSHALRLLNGSPSIQNGMGADQWMLDEQRAGINSPRPKNMYCMRTQGGVLCQTY